MNLQEIASLVQLLAPPALAAVAWYLRRLEGPIAGVESQLRAMNGRLLKMEEWRMMHDRQDDERELRTRDDIRHVEESLARQMESGRARIRPA